MKKQKELSSWKQKGTKRNASPTNDEGDKKKKSDFAKLDPKENDDEQIDRNINTKETTKEYKDFLKLPDELENVDFTERIMWGKFSPYKDNKGKTFPALNLSTPPISIEQLHEYEHAHSNNDEKNPLFSKQYPALCLQIHATCGRARACTLHLPHGPVALPVFMPVGTKGTIKGLTTEEIQMDKALDCRIILGNTYHLALAPGTDILNDMGGLHRFMNWKNRNILTDSGGFQMVSLLKLAEITEEGVTFESPFQHPNETNLSKKMLLRPEDSILHQNKIGADIIMALDDVVSSVADDRDRFKIATYRTLRWLDRCFEAHQNPHKQNLFPIVQGGLDTSLNGLREHCLAGFRNRDSFIPGYAIGGLAGGESKEDFWKVVDQCCKALPDKKPRYLMGVGYPLDLVVCTALGVDMYDCVYPTRTARFGVALVDSEWPGILRLRSNAFQNDQRPIMEGCMCAACDEKKGGYSRARLHEMLKSSNPLAAQLMTHHNIAYMMALTRKMRKAIIENRYDAFVKSFINTYFTGKENGGENVPQWVVDALNAAGIDILS